MTIPVSSSRYIVVDLDVFPAREERSFRPSLFDRPVRMALEGGDITIFVGEVGARQTPDYLNLTDVHCNVFDSHSPSKLCNRQADDHAEFVYLSWQKPIHT